MTAGLVLLTCGGLVMFGGLAALAAWWRGVALLPRRRLHRWRPTLLHLVAAGAGLVVLLVTGWPVAALAAFAAVVFVPKVFGGGGAAMAGVERAEALGAWARRLSDLIASGAAGSIPDAIGMSAAAPPAAIAGPVVAAAARLPVAGLEVAMRRLAVEVASPAAGKIAGVLILAERHGGMGLSTVLAELADDMEQYGRMLREVEAERAKPRGNARTIVVTAAVIMAGMMLFSRSFLSGYSTPVGQALLAIVFAVFAIALRWMRRLGDPPEPTEVLTDPAREAA